MEMWYYPGCTLKTKAESFDIAARSAMQALDISLRELPRWNCCGATFSLSEDDLIHQVAPVRNLVRAAEQGAQKLVTLCSFCYNTLKRANNMILADPEKKDTLNRFMDEEPDYGGEVETVHLLEVLRDDVGWEKIKQKVVRPLSGIAVAPYYGCTLVRPRDVAIDDVEQPVVMHRLLEALGAEVIDFPYANECCSSYQLVNAPDAGLECAWNILSSAARQGAEVLALACPLCEYNLGLKQPEIIQQHNDFKPLPVLYFTQLLALALHGKEGGIDDSLGLAEHSSFLKIKGLID
ncbi:MAG: heterodisulfide reductase, subunit B [Deltaproteobacteria bacterium]|nr:heterodisulfide reductase, subunit B [Deltaproteobacteria bacterium]